jgi:hypothetical protein
MIDYAVLKIEIQRLNEQTFSYLNMKNIEAAKKTAIKLEMNTMMLNKYIEWIDQNRVK